FFIARLNMLAHDRRCSRLVGSAILPTSTGRHSLPVKVNGASSEEPDVPSKRGNNEGSITKRSHGRQEARRNRCYGEMRQGAIQELAQALHNRDKGLAPTGDDRLTVQRLYNLPGKLVQPARLCACTSRLCRAEYTDCLMPSATQYAPTTAHNYEGRFCPRFA